MPTIRRGGEFDKSSFGSSISQVIEMFYDWIHIISSSLRYFKRVKVSRVTFSINSSYESLQHKHNINVRKAIIFW